jgi:hypothetical protein
VIEVPLHAIAGRGTSTAMPRRRPAHVVAAYALLVGCGQALLVGCGQGGGEVVKAVVDKTDIGAGESASPSAEPVQPPPDHSAGTPSSSRTPDMSATSEASSPGFMCLMWRVCECNEGCVGVNVTSLPPTAGTPVTVAVGARAGQSAFIDTAKDKRGRDVLVVTPSDPAAPQICSNPSSHNMLGYGCEMNKSGAVPADACARGCGEP